jgi:hypothetical protein
VLPWQGTVAVEPEDRRVMTVTDETLTVDDPTGAARQIQFDLRELAERGVLLAYSSTLTLADRSRPEPLRLQLRAVDPPSFDGIDWPDDVRAGIDAQLEAAAAASLKLRGQLGRLVAVTIVGLGVLLVVLVVVLVLT